jgi:hypothetical protein
LPSRLKVLSPNNSPELFFFKLKFPKKADDNKIAMVEGQMVRMASYCLQLANQQFTKRRKVNVN